jgi:hypothetical protein
MQMFLLVIIPIPINTGMVALLADGMTASGAKRVALEDPECKPFCDTKMGLSSDMW